MSPVSAEQNRLDQSDPTIAEKALPSPVIDAARTPTSTPAVTREGSTVASTIAVRSITAVVVQGADDVPAQSYAGIIAGVVGRSLSRQELAGLASSIAQIVRSRGYPFATAVIAPQSMADGILRVTVDRGRIDAVRVVGAQNTTADAILVKTLITHRPVRQADLERALLLVGDLPGVRVKDSRFVQQDGFGILLVTIDQDRASAYAQLDNRGTDEVGPVRATLLGNVRGLVQDGDELGIVVAQTPIDVSEFTFLRARYAAPVDAAGSVLAVSGSYGWSHPGASLRRFDVTGRSGDVSVGYVRPLLRRKTSSVWASIDLRALTTRQALAGRTLRRDRLATLTGSLNGIATAGASTIRGEVSAQWGIPNVADLASRIDAGGKYSAVTYLVDWTVPVTGPFSIALASAGQIASRPLLAVAEIGLGGPSFARAYDYAERTGDYGLMGSLELRADAGRILPGVIDRLQLYGFGDGGSVGNRRGGTGGGTLASAGAGLRGGAGRVDAMLELAFPIGEDRFDTGDRKPRLSARLSRAF
ncbi:ShlB/FhaC/HecB family hemolysin secretion/activation protein [Sphingomonas sp. 1P08PE]|uniref:ShlB/FhaC/HecB family hemolysin secretion/activation protein n=1 Tax=Sphingomonas sp. 1P08PE TaxID=554122 RepID=UPI00399F5527